MIAKTTAGICRDFLSPVLKLRMIESLFQSNGSQLNRYRGLLAPRHCAYRSPSKRIYTTHGSRFQLDLSDYMDWKVYYNIGLESAHYLFSKINEDSIVLDIGANLGFYSLGSASVAKAGRVIAFEPDKRCHQKISANFALNEYPHLEVHRLALGRNTETKSLVRDSSGNSGLNHIAGHSENATADGNEIQTVKCTSLDEFAAKNALPPVNVLKIDIEGFESEFLAGAKETITASKPGILIEVCDHHLKRCESSAAQLISELRELGYTSFIDIETSQAIDESQLSDCQFDAWCESK